MVVVLGGGCGGAVAVIVASVDVDFVVCTEWLERLNDDSVRDRGRNDPNHDGRCLD